MTKSTKTIAFFGSSLLSAYWNGAATYYRGIIKALHEYGYRVTFYEPDAYERQQHRDIDEPAWAKVVVYSAREEELRTLVRQAAGQSDILIKASGVGVFDELLEALLPEEKREDQLIIFWDVDAPATLSRLHGNPADPFRALLPAYDMILTYGGGDPVVEQYLALGAQRCLPVYNALDPEDHFPVQARPQFSADLAFLGNRLPDREQRVDQFFLQPAAQMPKRRFLLAGSGWESKPMPGNVSYLGHLYTRDHNAFNCSPLAVLNISRESMALNGFSPATRVFEAAGAGACLITDAWEGIELFLEPGREVLVAANGEELTAILDNLQPEQAREIGEAARRRMLAHHTYAHRAALLHHLFQQELV